MKWLFRLAFLFCAITCFAQIRDWPKRQLDNGRGVLGQDGPVVLAALPDVVKGGSDDLSEK